jgi:hypothetical protein
MRCYHEPSASTVIPRAAKDCVAFKSRMRRRPCASLRLSSATSAATVLMLPGIRHICRYNPLISLWADAFSPWFCRVDLATKRGAGLGTRG